MTGRQCAKCGHRIVLKTPDEEGRFWCRHHSPVKKAAQVAPPPPVKADLKSRLTILAALERAHDIAEEKKDPHGMVAASRAAIHAVQMVDPMAPEQELGGFALTRVSGQQPRPGLPEPEPIQADAE
jgi:hypothetical protein